MKEKTALIIGIVILFAFASISGFSAQEEKKLSLNTNGIEVLDIECGAGSLIIKGGDDLKTIEVKAEIVAKNSSTGDIEKRVKLTLKKSGKKAFLVSKITSSGFFSLSKNARIDLELRVPRKLALVIDDGSGSIEINGMSDIELEDGSGSVDIEDLGGDLSIDDGSGSITVNTVKGDVKITDGSGSIKIYGIDGSVTIDDGSGGITIDGVQKNVTIKDAGSGSVNIENVKGTVKKYD